MRIFRTTLLLFFAASLLPVSLFADNDAISALKAGNERFVHQKMLHPRQSSKRVKEIAPKQGPSVAILSCSDSRVPPELIFDQGLGDIFVVRVAGNVLTKENLGSLQYAVEHLGVKDVVVLGHSRCGAVTAATSSQKPKGDVKSVIKALEPAVKEAKRTCNKCDLVETASHINVERTVQKLKSELNVNVTGAYYDLDSGKVDFLN